LAGDAAHVNNPIGGMGLNGGIQDAVNLSAKLIGILLGEESDRSLDLYNLQRRTVATDFVQEQSIANKKRLEESDPKTRQKKLEKLARIAENPERARQFLLRTSMIATPTKADPLTLNCPPVSCGNSPWCIRSFVTQACNNPLGPAGTGVNHRLIAAGTWVGSPSRSP